MTKRENALDLLRILAALLVVGAHVYTSAYHSSNLSGAFRIYYRAFRYTAEMAVPVFFMLSGGFVIASPKTMDYKSFFKKTWKKLGIPTLIFTVFYFFERIFFLNITDELISYDEPFKTSVLVTLRDTLTGKPEAHMWYMYTLIGIYLLCPFIALFKNAASDRAFKIFIWTVWIWGTLSNLTGASKYFWSLGYCANMAGIFLLGYIAHEWGLKLKGTKKGWYLLILSAALLALSLIFALDFKDIDMLLGHSAPFNPIINLAAFFTVAAFSSFELKHEFGIVSASTLWVYLLHPVVMNIVLFAEEVILDMPFEEVGAADLLVIPNVNYVIVALLTFAAAIILEKIKRTVSLRRMT